MRICYLSNTAIPSSAASSIQIVKMCEAFSKLNNEVFLITTGVIKSNLIYTKYYNIKKKFILERVISFSKFPLGFSYYLFSLVSILKSLKYRPDIYITRNFFTCFLLILFKKKIVLELHHDLNMESRIVRFLVKYTNFLNSKYIIKIIAITNNVKNIYEKDHKIINNKILVLPSGSSINSRFNFNNNCKAFKIGYLGSLYESRGLNLIFNLAKIDTHNEYYLYGDTKQIKNRWKYKFVKNLHLNNHLPYKIVAKTLSEMDILLIPYTSLITVAGNVGNITDFTSPLKLFDYLAAGKIIICSNYSVLKEVLKKNKNAFFINNFKNVYAWRNEIRKISFLKTKQLIMAKNNYKLSKYYSLDKRAKKIINSLNL